MASSAEMSDEFLIFNPETKAYLARTKGSDARSSSKKEDAVVFRALFESLDQEPAAVGVIPSKNCSFYLRTDDGFFLERTCLITGSGDLRIHKAHRFRLGFVANPSQTWNWSHGNSQEGRGLQFDELCGFSCGGTNQDDETSPMTSERRVMTLRPGDAPQVLVSWWNSHEKLVLLPVAGRVNVKPAKR